MSKYRGPGVVAVMAGLLLPTACEQALRTGKVGNTTSAPASDGTCPAGLSVCGKGGFALCLDLQTNPEHCGTCGNACTLGIACAAGTCQQVACTGSITVSVQEVPGSAATTPVASYAGGILADVNGDGRLDLVTWANTPPGNGSFQVALGAAGGGFGAASSYQASTDVQNILAADANSDGIQDLYINDSFGTPCVEIWLGQVDGKLTRTASTDVAGCLNTIAIADLNGDGTMDVVTPDDHGGGPRVYLADAKGAFHAAMVYASKQQVLRFVVRDWDGDGSPDLVALSQTLSLYLNKGNGTFADEMICAVATENPIQAVIADFNRDGHLDVASGMEAGVGVLLGLGGCQFHPMAEYQTAGVGGLAHGDLNGDGSMDLVAQASDGTLSLLLGQADGSFRPATLTPLAGSSSANLDMVAVAEVTGDGKPDIVIVDRMGATRILGNTCP